MVRYRLFRSGPELAVPHAKMTNQEGLSSNAFFCLQIASVEMKQTLEGWVGQARKGEH